MHGTGGKMMIPAPALPLQELLRLPDLESVIATLRKFPNCSVDVVTTSVPGLSVIWKNWNRYQSDPGTQGGRKTKSTFSEAESGFARILESRGLTFLRQQRWPFKKTFYTVDFYLPDLRLAFEINGPEHSTAKYRELDQRKSVYLMTHYGVLVVAIDNGSVLTNPIFTERFVIGCIEERSSSQIGRSSPQQEKRRDEKRLTTKEKEETTTLSGKPDLSSLREQAQEVLGYLNKRSGRAFRPVDTNIRMIVALLREGVTVDQCRAVIGLRAAKWKGDPKMEEYLRPLTIFRPSNFHQYMGDLPLPTPDPEAPPP